MYQRKIIGNYRNEWGHNCVLNIKYGSEGRDIIDIGSRFLRKNIVHNFIHQQ